MRIQVLAFFLFLGLAGLPGRAAIHLPALFTDHMVLQRNAQVTVWGWGNPAEQIKIVGSWQQADTVTVTAGNNSYWSARLNTVEAGGPYTLTFIGSSTIRLNDVMLGEVWICSGQSNMEWAVDYGVTNGEREAAAAQYPDIRFFHVPRIGAATPQQDCKAAWAPCTPSTMRATSAVGYFFGRELHQHLNVPVGLIVSAWSGTPAETWVPRELITADPVLQAALAPEHDPRWPTDPGVTYNGMIAPLIPYRVAGAIWYQGESNRFKPGAYAHLLQKLVGQWRQDFASELPFYYVQIAPFTYRPGEKAYVVREQQAKAQAMIPRSGMVVVSDLVDNVSDIHPRNKTDVGKRLARYALAETYGKPAGAYRSPAYRDMRVEKNKVRVFFDHAPNGLVSRGKTVTGCQVAGADRKFVPAEAAVSGSTLLVHSKAVPRPVAVRFCFDNASTPNVFSREGLPVAPFRTDDWEVGD